MQQNAEIILDSIIEDERIITIRYEIWQTIWRHMLTYRRCARNASSSRAIPFVINHARVVQDPFIPKWIGKTHRGMQPDTFFEGQEYEEVASAIKVTAWRVAYIANELYEKGVAKSTLNRMLEPYNTINVLMTGSIHHWNHVFSQRCSIENGGDGTAERNLSDLIDSIKSLVYASIPVEREGHIPFIREGETDKNSVLSAISAARCARISYCPHGMTISDPMADIELSKKLIKEGHLSPFEHIVFSPREEWVSHYKIENRNAISDSVVTYRQVIENVNNFHLQLCLLSPEHLLPVKRWPFHAVPAGH